MPDTTVRTLILAAAFALAAHANMRYELSIVVAPPPTLGRPPAPTTTFCPTGTLAVGMEVQHTGIAVNGLQLLCAETSDHGFWTSPVRGNFLGSSGTAATQMLCPSGAALIALNSVPVTEGINLVWGLRIVCSTLDPDFASGTVAPLPPIAVAYGPEPEGTAPAVLCPSGKYIAALRPFYTGANLTALGVPACANVLTRQIPFGGSQPSDLALRTIGLNSHLATGSIDNFTVEIHNLDKQAVSPFNRRVRLTSGDPRWRIDVSNTTTRCDPVFQRVGFDLRVTAHDCEIPAIGGRGSAVIKGLRLTPTATTTGELDEPITAARARLIFTGDAIPGDSVAENDTANFPVHAYQP